MGYLRYFDYQKLIQDANFQQIIASNDVFRTDMERAAQAEMISYLVQKYDTEYEFTDTTTFDIDTQYNAASLVQLDATAYSASSTYALNTLALNTGIVYICTTAITVAEPFNAAKWRVVGNQYDLYYIALPYPLFNINEVYAKEDRVIWKNKVYECLLPTIVPGHEAILQAPSYSALPPYNFFPDNKTNGRHQWGTGVTYSATGLVPNAPSPAAWSSVTTYAQGDKVIFEDVVWLALANSTNVEPGSDIVTWQSEQWINGDNRSQQMVLYMVDIVLYHLLSRIAPRNIPEYRVKRYDKACAWLQDVAVGTVTADIPVKQPTQGERIRFGGNIKLQNDY